MTELETKKAIEEQEKIGKAFADTECMKQVAVNLARIVDRLDTIERLVNLMRS